ncbi:MAG: hypothetical protein ABJG41_17280 [Cyclobacteriaceae bacterium]
MKHLAILSLLISIISYSCNEAGTPPDCSGNFACTEVFITIGVDIKNSSGQAVTLDSASVTNQKSGVSHSPSYDSYPDFASYYGIADDADLDDVDYDGTVFLFEGWLEGEKVVSEEFLIGKDCCHILKLEGPKEITLD